MRYRQQTKVFLQQGFTLLETILVSVIIGGLLVLGINILKQQMQSMQLNRAAEQMQQILNAGLAYYVNNNTWPTDIATLRTNGYLPTTFLSPWGTAYTVSSTTSILSVRFTFPAAVASQSNLAKMLAGKVPFATVSGVTPPVSVTANVNLPSQDLSNAESTNYVGLYHHGGCVPTPNCPVDRNGNARTPQVFIVPVSVSGVNDAGSPPKVYPISSFTAYAKAAQTSPDPCSSGASAPACGGTSPSGKYWRVCAQIVTERGDVATTNTDQWGQSITLAAFTRCASTSEQTGSTMGDYSN